MLKKHIKHFGQEPFCKFRNRNQTGSALARPHSLGSWVKRDKQSRCPEGSEPELAGRGGIVGLASCSPLSPAGPKDRKTKTRVRSHTWYSPQLSSPLLGLKQSQICQRDQEYTNPHQTSLSLVFALPSLRYSQQSLLVKPGISRYDPHWRNSLSPHPTDLLA